MLFAATVVMQVLLMQVLLPLLGRKATAAAAAAASMAAIRVLFNIHALTAASYVMFTVAEG